MQKTTKWNFHQPISPKWSAITVYAMILMVLILNLGSYPSSLSIDQKKTRPILESTVWKLWRDNYCCLKRRTYLQCWNFRTDRVILVLRNDLRRIPVPWIKHTRQKYIGFCDKKRTSWYKTRFLVGESIRIQSLHCRHGLSMYGKNGNESNSKRMCHRYSAFCAPTIFKWL